MALDGLADHLASQPLGIDIAMAVTTPQGQNFTRHLKLDRAACTGIDLAHRHTRIDGSAIGGVPQILIGVNPDRLAVHLADQLV
jgi:hypothetical protein